MQTDSTATRKMVDPRVAFAFVLYLTSSVIILREAHRIAPIFLLALVCAVVMRIGFKQLFFKLRRLWYVIIFVAVLQGIFNPSGDIWLQIGRVSILTSGGVSTGLAVLMRLATIIVGGSILSRYANRVLIQAMIQLHLPFEFAYMVSVGLRFIPLSVQAFKDSLTAIQLRGIDFDKLAFKQRMKVYVYLLMPTIAAGLNDAHELAMAMELRGFRAHDKRTSYFLLHMQQRDWVALAAVVLLAVATTVVNILF